MDKWAIVRKDYEASTLTLAELAEKHDVKLGSLKSKKSRDTKDGDPWIRAGDKVATKIKKVATKGDKVATKKSAATNININDDEMIDLRMDEPSVNEEELRVSGDFTDKQIQFISYYVKYWNATKAYQKAYNCAYSTAMVNGNALLRNTKIRDEITRVRDALSENALLDRRTLLQKWIDIAFADITDFVSFGNEQEVERDYETGEVKLDANGNPKMRTYSYVNLKDDAEVDGTILTSVTLGKDGVGVKLADKMKALEYLSKHMDLLSDNEKTKFKTEQRKAAALIDKAEADAKLKAKELQVLDEANKDKSITINFVRKGDAK